jgi:RNA polymerase sigma factor (sigma-70 family)
MADEFVIGTHPDRTADEAYAEAASRLVRYLRGVGYADPEDIAQEAIFRAVRDGIRPTAWGWLKQVAKRIAIDEHRKRRTVPIGGMADLETDGGRFPSAEDGAMDRESLRIIDDALKALPPRYREALLVSARNEGRGVGADLDLTGPAARSLLYRARARFRAELERLGYGLLWLRDLVSPSRDQLAMFCVVICAVALPLPTSDVPGSPRVRTRDVRTTPHRASSVAAQTGSVTLRVVTAERPRVATPTTKRSMPVVESYGGAVCATNSEGEQERYGVTVGTMDDGRPSPVYETVRPLLPLPEQIELRVPVGEPCRDET